MSTEPTTKPDPEPEHTEDTPEREDKAWPPPGIETK